MRPATPAGSNRQALSGGRFQARFLMLIFLAWTVPVLIGLWYLRLIEMFTAEQLRAVMSAPGKPLMNLGVLIFISVYFWRYARPIAGYLDNPARRGAGEAALRCMRRFPLHFWTLFVAYMLLAPSSMIVFAEMYAGYDARPEDWFRIHLVALVVSIIVGLPIFFRILDLFGRTVGALSLRHPHVTLRTKVFLIGALIPLLVDTALVQYYWARTGHFGLDTFMIWLSLELLAIAGSLLFVRSFGQALEPLEGLLGDRRLIGDVAALVPQSTDELGVLAGGYRDLLQRLRTHSDVLNLSNRLLRTERGEAGVGQMFEELVDLCQRAIGGDSIFLLIHEPDTDELVAVAQTGEPYRPEGFFRLAREETSLATWVFREGRTATSPDLSGDPRISERLRARFDSKAIIAAPLQVEGRSVGVLTCTSEAGPREYSDADVMLVEVFAREAALTVHAQLLRRERAQADAVRVERDAQFRLLLESTAEGIFGADLIGTCTFVNPACLRMLGYAHEDELLGKNIHEMVHHSHPDGRPYLKQDCRARLATLAGESGHSDREVHWRKDGSSLPVEWWSHPVYRDGELVGSVVTFVDITERKRAAEVLRRLHQDNRLLLESTSDGIFGVDTELRCTFANRSAAQMLGFAFDEMEGRDMHALVQHSREDGTPLRREESVIYRAIHEDASFWSDTEVLWYRGESAFPVQYSSNPIHEDGRVTGAVVVFRNVAEARAMARQMDYLATHDPLTGLTNRRAFESRLADALEGARQRGEGHVLCYMDLDQFKVVNDTCGHVAGDELLRQLTMLLSARVRQGDTLARLGGDEFGVLLEHCPLARAESIAQDLWATVQDFRFTWEERTFSIGVSIGVVPVEADTKGVGAALAAADAACYMAKDGGRNQVHICEADDAAIARRRGEMQWVSRVRDALDRGRLELSYQSIVPIAPAESGGGMVELLLRMRDGRGELIPPGAFLPAAERYNLMPSVDRWVVQTTLKWLCEHSENLGHIDLYTINLSGHSLGDASLLPFVIGQLEHFAVDPQRLCFEVTETAAVANLAQAVRFMRELRAVGCAFALDDFGSGMSSFAYLKNLPVDFLKIDGNFVRDMASDPIDHAMVEAINQVGHVMGLRTVAEFVENASILDALRDIGVDFAQGYGIAAPRPLYELIGETAQRPARPMHGNRALREDG